MDSKEDLSRRDEKKRKRERHEESSECSKRVKIETSKGPSEDMIRRCCQCLAKDIEIRALRERVANLENELRRYKEKERNYRRTVASDSDRYKNTGETVVEVKAGTSRDEEEERRMHDLEEFETSDVEEVSFF